jgi:hypothetical protein
MQKPFESHPQNFQFCFLSQKKDPQQAGFLFGGGDVRKFEPVKRLNIRSLDLIIRKLRQIYKENPAYFDIPEFVQKVY